MTKHLLTCPKKNVLPLALNCKRAALFSALFSIYIEFWKKYFWIVDDWLMIIPKCSKVFKMFEKQRIYKIDRKLWIFKKIHWQRGLKKGAKKSALCARAHQFFRTALTLRSFLKNWAPLFLRSRRKERRSEHRSKERAHSCSAAWYSSGELFKWESLNF